MDETVAGLSVLYDKGDETGPSNMFRHHTDFLKVSKAIAYFFLYFFFLFAKKMGQGVVIIRGKCKGNKRVKW